jgi:hypothetical protein
MSRPILPWRSPLVALPDNAKEVWIRRLPWYDVPVRATYDTGTDTFNVLVPVGTEQTPLQLSVTSVAVHSWKFQFKPDELAQFPPA